MAKKKKSVDEQSSTDNKTTDIATSGSVLEKVGKRAIKEHGLKEVFVTSDGTVFRNDHDAKNYAFNLKNKTILNVKN